MLLDIDVSLVAKGYGISLEEKILCSNGVTESSVNVTKLANELTVSYNMLCEKDESQGPSDIKINSRGYEVRNMLRIANFSPSTDTGKNRPYSKSNLKFKIDTLNNQNGGYLFIDMTSLAKLKESIKKGYRLTPGINYSHDVVWKNNDLIITYRVYEVSAKIALEIYDHGDFDEKGKFTYKQFTERFPYDQWGFDPKKLVDDTSSKSKQILFATNIALF